MQPFAGIGIANRVYGTPIHNCGDFKLTIVHLEMINIIVALRVRGRLWQHGSISVRCDNLGVVQVVRIGKTKDSFLALCVWNIWLLTAAYDIELHIDHIPGCKNLITDTLSRIYSDRTVNSLTLHDLEFNFIWDRVPAGYFDLNSHL